MSYLVAESLWLSPSIALTEVVGFCCFSSFLLTRDTIHSPAYLAVPPPGRNHKAVTGVWVQFVCLTCNEILAMLSCLNVVCLFVCIEMINKSLWKLLHNLKLRVYNLHVPVIKRLSKLGLQGVQVFVLLRN